MIREDVTAAELLVEHGEDLIARLVRARDPRVKATLGRQLLDVFAKLERVALQANAGAREAADD